MSNPNIIILLIVVLTASFSTEGNESKAMTSDLRSLAFTVKPADIGISKEKLGDVVWGVVMETGYPDGSFSLIVMADGSTSLYYSNGGGIIGGGGHDSVRKVSKDYLLNAQSYYSHGSIVNKYPRPNGGEVKFYFLTFDGIRAYTALENNLGGSNDKLSDLFFSAHNVITELRKVE